MTAISQSDQAHGDEAHLDEARGDEPQSLAQLGARQVLWVLLSAALGLAQPPARQHDPPDRPRA